MAAQRTGCIEIIEAPGRDVGDADRNGFAHGFQTSFVTGFPSLGWEQTLSIRCAYAPLPVDTALPRYHIFAAEDDPGTLTGTMSHALGTLPACFRTAARIEPVDGRGLTGIACAGTKPRARLVAPRGNQAIPVRRNYE